VISEKRRIKDYGLREKRQSKAAAKAT